MLGIKQSTNNRKYSSTVKTIVQPNQNTATYIQWVLNNLLRFLKRNHELYITIRTTAVNNFSV